MQWIHAWMNLKYNIKPLVVLMSTRTFFIFCLNLENFVFDVSWEKEKSFDVLCMYITQWMWFVYYKKPLIQKQHREWKLLASYSVHDINLYLFSKKRSSQNFSEIGTIVAVQIPQTGFFEKVIQNTSFLKFLFCFWRPFCLNNITYCFPT